MQMGRFRVDLGSSLYHLEVNDNFQIQFDPRHPSRYYSRDYRIPLEVRNLFMILLFFASGAILSWALNVLLH